MARSPSQQPLNANEEIGVPAINFDSLCAEATVQYTLGRMAPCSTIVAVMVDGSSTGHSPHAAEIEPLRGTGPRSALDTPLVNDRSSSRSL
jgi:hypothetical protein